MAKPRHRDDPVALGKADAAHARRRTAHKHAHAGHRKADALAHVRGQQHVVLGRKRTHPHQTVAVVELHRNLAVCHDVDEVGKRVAPDPAARGREHDEQIAPALLVLGQRHQRRDGLALLQGKKVDHRLAARLGRPHRQGIDLELVDDPRRREEQHRGVGVGHEHLAHEVLFARAHAHPALAATPLGSVGVQGDALDVAGVRDRDHHVLALDQVLDVVLELGRLNGGPPRCRKAFAHFGKFGLEDAEQAGA